MKLIGIQRVDYTNKNGYHVTGYKLHTSIPARTNDCIGEFTEAIFVSEQVFLNCAQLSVGDEISVAYNKYGKVTGVSVIG
jgi:hypothetical protein